MCVVDLFRVYRNKDKTYLEWDVLKFADFLSADLHEIMHRPTNLTMGDPTQVLKRITDEVGNFNKPLTKYQRERNLAKGNCVSGPCYICKKYEPEGKYNRTTWECSGCGTFLCLIDRKGKRGRVRTCLDEHMYSDDPAIKCNCDGLRKSNFPKAKRFRHE